MRFLILGCAILTLSAMPLMAAENFIPLGQNYAPGDDTLPPIGSEEDQVNAQTDIYQTETYGRQLRDQEMNSRLRDLSQRSLNPGSDDDLEY